MKASRTFPLVFAVVGAVVGAAIGASIAVDAVRAGAGTGAPAPGTEPAPTLEARRLLHPEFDLTIEELSELVRSAPEEAQRAILSSPEHFLDLMAQALDLPEDFLVLVDKQHHLPASYVPGDLIALPDWAETLDHPLLLNREGLSLRQVVLEDLSNMIQAALSDGVRLLISSTYRSYEYQAMLFERYSARHGIEQARRFSAQPGASQHQLGTAIDFGDITPAFAESAAGIWMKENAHRFGFSLSYPEGMEELTGYIWEPWHFRWITQLGTTLEHEYFQGVQQHFLEFFNSAAPQLREARHQEPSGTTSTEG